MSDFSGVIPDIVYISNERLDNIASALTGLPERPTLSSRSFLREPIMNGATSRLSGSSTLSME